MSRSIFGWAYPPGAEHDPNAPWNQVDPPCEICGKQEGSCICPECSVCQAIGDPVCYTRHGMVVSEAQAASLKAEELKWDREAAQEAAAEAEMEYRKFHHTQESKS